MSARPSPSLQGAGLAAMTPRGQMPEGSGLGVKDVETRLARYSQKHQHSQSMGRSTGPHTARSLLEENQRLSTIKNESKKLDRRASKELVDEMLNRDQQNQEYDRKKQQKRRETHQALAQKYRSAIFQNELSRAEEYAKKQASGPGEVFFPFTEGETVEQYRQAQNSMLRCEMQHYMRDQSEKCPPRCDELMASVSHQHHQLYDAIAGSGPPKKPVSDGKPAVPHHIGGQHPLFLSRNREHMSRRTHDSHVTQTMNDKVELFKTQIEQLAADKHREAHQHEEGMMINDALRYDIALMKASERKKTQEFLKVQIADREARVAQEKKEQHAECCGYFGPEEKPLQRPELYADHCNQLISQMKTDQHRRLDVKHRQLQEEKQIVNNTMQVMMTDRDKAVEKVERHKDILTKSWKNQKKIRSAMETVERIGA